jgi:hypothetical protein
MKKMLSIFGLITFVVLTTGTFALAEYQMAGPGSFPFFQLGCLIVGGLTIISLKQRYQKLYMSEAAGAFALYAVLVALSTSPVAEAVKTLIS